MLRELALEELERYLEIAARAYPGLKVVSADERKRFLEAQTRNYQENETSHYYGCFRDEELHGGMMLYDFEMNWNSHLLPVGGVGLVAVDLHHKKEHVAKDMLTFFLEHYREKGAPLAALYPFRPDFYKKMGFGFGTKNNHYRLKPSELPKGSKNNVRRLTAEDVGSIHACYNRYVRQTHGMMVKSPFNIGNLFRIDALHFAGVELDGELRGYIVYQFDVNDPGNNLTNDLFIRELVYETPEALSQLLAFLQSQADQFKRVVHNTQDPHFHHLVSDPRDESDRMYPFVTHQTNLSGVGLMYRVIHTQGLFRALEGHDFGGQTVRLKLTVQDDFLPANDGSTLLHVENGRATVVENGEHDVELTLHVSDFSSLIMGVVPLRQLWRYGKAQVSDASYVGTLDRLFRSEQPPMCTTAF
jgi:predicted acetyltransferase